MVYGEYLEHDDNNHAVGHQFINQIFFRPLETSGKKPFFLRLHGERHVKKTVRHEVKPDNLRGKKRERNTHKKSSSNRKHLAHACRKKIQNYLLDGFINPSSLFHRRNNASEIVV